MAVSAYAKARVRGAETLRRALLDTASRLLVKHGPDALTIADRSFCPKGKGSQKPSAAATHTIHYGTIHKDGQVIDEVMLAVMCAPRVCMPGPL